ncbi:hypothetical protein GCM10023187_28720 [Nibrella viscosa]|uniref:DUF2490 domain-containing protein n=1 Tax=Nibrella viscosa TaxID=1084524 RepID=A0ABP8KJ60_9BACT
MRGIYCYFVVLLTLLGNKTEGLAQHYSHTAIWLRLAPSWTISKSVLISGDFHYRRQSDPDHLLNPVYAPLTKAGRLGLTYRYGSWSLQLNPLMYFQSYPALGTTADFSRPVNKEFRMSALLEWNLPVSRQMDVRLRGGYEYRLFANGTTAGRMRFRLMTRHQLSELYYFYVWNETLLAGPPNWNRFHPFEINRTALNLGYTISEHVSCEGGYQFSHRRRKSLIEFDEEHALLLTVFLRI